MKALILAAGKGTRMKSQKAKVLHDLLGRPMLQYVLEALSACRVSKMAVVVGAHGDQVRTFLHAWAKKTGHALPKAIEQKEQKGTGHAVMMAKSFFAGSSEDVLIWPGDMPLISFESLKGFIKRHQESKADASVLSAVVKDPKGYGRILRQNDHFFAIREELDATEVEKQIGEINTGVYLFKSKRLTWALEKIKPVNAKGEFYLTDTIEALVSEGKNVEAFALIQGGEAEGINSREQLAKAIQTLNQRGIKKLMESGVTFISPEQTFVEPGAQIGEDTTIYPWTYIESEVKIGKHCQIGPCAKIRNGTVVGDCGVIGSFVELSRSKLGKGVLAKHLAYLGNAEIGPGTNIGAGTITANFDGVHKHSTYIGKKVLIGSNTVLVAPVHIGDSAKTGAGAVVTRGTRIPPKGVAVGVPARLRPRT